MVGVGAPGGSEMEPRTSSRTRRPTWRIVKMLSPVIPSGTWRVVSLHWVRKYPSSRKTYAHARFSPPEAGCAEPCGPRALGGVVRDGVAEVEHLVLGPSHRGHADRVGGDVLELRGAAQPYARAHREAPGAQVAGVAD